ETHGKRTPNLEDVTRRLRQHNAAIRRSEELLEELDDERPPEIPADDRLIEDLVEFLGEQVMSGRKPNKVRAFFGSFLERVDLHRDRVDLRYRPEKLLPAPDHGSVHGRTGVLGSAIWLPGTDSNCRQGG